MSASEKLKALVVEIDRHGGASPNHKAAFYAHIRYLGALPQIVAVVKAAEDFPEIFVVDGRSHSFVPLLATLDEALS